MHHLRVSEDDHCSVGGLLLYEKLQELVHGLVQRLQVLRACVPRWNKYAHLLALDAARRHRQLREAGDEPYACLLPVDTVVLCRMWPFTISTSANNRLTI